MARNGSRKGEDAFLLALASGVTVKDAAAKAGISERQGHRRVEEPRFRRQVSRLRAELIDRAAGRLADGASEAADCLRSLLSTEAPSVRLGAARALLEMAFRSRELLEYEERLRKVEEVIHAQEQIAEG